MANFFIKSTIAKQENINPIRFFCQDKKKLPSEDALCQYYKLKLPCMLKSELSMYATSSVGSTLKELKKKSQIFSLYAFTKISKIYYIPYAFHH